VTGRNERAIEDHFDANLELETTLRAIGQHAQADMVHNILPSGVECIFEHQAEQLGLGHAILCAERLVGNEPFAVLLGNNFLTQKSASNTSNMSEDLKNAFETTSQM
jgi:UTP--glucose-1-phosphate uridylyltransferase